MARIRAIKPSFFTSEDVIALSPLARLFYVALWCEADREGRLEWKLRTLKFRYLPGDDCDIDALSDELQAWPEEGLPHVVVYEVDGKRYGFIPSFKKHQHVNAREPESVIPPCPDEYLTCTCTHVPARVEGKGREGKGKEEEPPHSPPKGGPSRKPKVTVEGDDILAMLPESFKTQTVRDAISSWVAYRRERGKPITRTTAVAQARKMKEMGPDLTVKAINTGIERQWQGLFVPKEETVQTKKPTGFDAGLAVIRQAEEEEREEERRRKAGNPAYGILPRLEVPGGG